MRSSMSASFSWVSWNEPIGRSNCRRWWAYARPGSAFAVAGAAIACFEAARSSAQQRRQFDRPIGSFQLTQEKLADMLERIVQAQLLGHRVLRLKDEGKLPPVLVSLAKRANVRSALEVARSARTILGANGITDDL